MKFTSVFLLLLAVSLFAPFASAGTVTVTSPTNGSTLMSPVNVHATYNGTAPATYMKVWVDHVAGTTQHSTNVFDATIALANGKHLIEVQAKDANSGTVFTTALNITVVSAAITVSPGSVSLPPGGMQQFTATDNAGLSYTWSATGGTITSAGLYTAGVTAGNFSVTATDTNGSAASAIVTIAAANSVIIQTPGGGTTVSSPLHVQAVYNASAPATYMKLWLDGDPRTIQRSTNFFDTFVGLANGAHEIEVAAKDSTTGVVYKSKVLVTVAGASLSYTTWKNDNARTGQQNNETVLTPTNVNSSKFGFMFSNPVDGFVYAQPLYMPNVSIGGNLHNVVFVETEGDSVYAFDADAPGAPLWQISIIPQGGSTVPQSLVGSSIQPQIGITSTPVIDAVAKTMYLVGETLENGSIIFRLHALDITNGNERPGSPVVISAPNFQPKEQLQRSGLLLANGNIYFAYASHGDHLPYNGWVFAYNATSLAQTATWNDTPTGSMGGIWMGGAGIAADSNGDIYVASGNGTWDGNTNLSMSFIRLTPNLNVVDFFTPFNQASLSKADLDFGAGGILLLPDLPSVSPHELVGCGKPSPIYVVDRDNMGHRHSGDDSQIVQSLPNVVGGTSGIQANDHCFTTPAYWQANLYFVGNNDVIKSFSLDPATGKLSSTPTSQGSFIFVFPGAQPVVSSNGTSNGIVWAVDRSSSVSLHAYSATDLTNELYRSGGIGAGTKWAVPTVINGKVYVGTQTKLVVFGPE
ncbi:MAG: Ig-like domain-containing protein [Acidobacteriota bacterium]|nr:Ig-like domain-containing protein [Acidobacteriota bacterium]